MSQAYQPPETPPGSVAKTVQHIYDVLNEIEGSGPAGTTTSSGGGGGGGASVLSTSEEDVVTSFNQRQGAVYFRAEDVTDALGYVPVDEATALTGGDGIGRIGDLSTGRTVAVDSTVARTDQTETFGEHVTIEKGLDVYGELKIIDGGTASSYKSETVEIADSMLEVNTDATVDAWGGTYVYRGRKDDGTGSGLISKSVVWNPSVDAWGVADVSAEKDGSGANVGSGVKTGTFQQLWHEGNDGPGSGLDADTVDGYNGSDLAALSEDETVSGTWKFIDEVRVEKSSDSRRDLVLKPLSIRGGKFADLRIIGEANDSGEGIRIQNDDPGNTNAPVDIAFFDKQQRVGLGGETNPSYALDVNGQVRGQDGLRVSTSSGDYEIQGDGSGNLEILTPSGNRQVMFNNGDIGAFQ